MSELSDRQCPECGTSLHARATYCGCGWGKPRKGHAAPVEPRASCAFDLCGSAAIVKVKSSNLCARHYEELAKISAEKYCAGLGLTTVSQRRQWVKQNNRGLKRFHQAAPVIEDEAESIPF